MDTVKLFSPFKMVRQNKSVMDQRDNVNRVSYVNSTEYVQRMIYEGENLLSHRARAMRSGLYKADEALKENAEVPAIPVYEQDPVIASQTIAAYQDELSAHVEESAAAAAPVESVAAETAANVEADNN